MISKQKIVSLIDLTQLGDSDTEADILKLCSKAKNSLGSVAAICVYKQFIPLVKGKLGQEFKVATVINFPRGDNSIEEVLVEARDALRLGADEIDLVIDYKDYIRNGQSKYSCELVKGVKKVCEDKVLKVIIESGELKSQTLIKKASDDAITNGASFVKTSTGKTSTGATLEAAEIILKSIAASNKNVGFKASGGIKNYSQAIDYVEITEKFLSDDYLSPNTFRFGVSSLLDDLLNHKKESEYDY